MKTLDAYIGDFMTCRSFLSQVMRTQRGQWLGARCNTIVPLKEFPTLCSFCGARVV